MNTNYIYRDYQLVGETLLKENLDDEKHLMWMPGFGGIPCIDAIHVWDKLRPYIQNIQISTKGGRVFRITKEIFDKNKKELDAGYGKQYYIEKKYWTIFDPIRRQRQFQQKEIGEEKLNQQKLL
jgi:hypothetical protein